MPGTTDLATAYELAAQWHDKHSRGAREIADDIRVGPDIQAKALVASKHHAASAAGLRPGLRRLGGFPLISVERVREKPLDFPIGGPHRRDKRNGAFGISGLRGCGVELFERMRAIQDCNPARPDLPDHHGIGGHLDLTTVTSDGCVTERLRTWSDEVGRKIVPDVVRAA